MIGYIDQQLMQLAIAYGAWRERKQKGSALSGGIMLMKVIAVLVTSYVYYYSQDPIITVGVVMGFYLTISRLATACDTTPEQEFYNGYATRVHRLQSIATGAILFAVGAGIDYALYTSIPFSLFFGSLGLLMVLQSYLYSADHTDLAEA